MLLNRGVLTRTLRGAKPVDMMRTQPADDGVLARQRRAGAMRGASGNVEVCALSTPARSTGGDGWPAKGPSFTIQSRARDVDTVLDVGKASPRGSSRSCLRAPGSRRSSIARSFFIIKDLFTRDQEVRSRCSPKIENLLLS